MWRALTDAVGAEKRDALWAQPDLIPTSDDIDNPAALEHNVAIEKDGEEIAVSELIKESKTSVSAELAPGTYTFLCTVPGHAEAGMEGTLVVK